MFVGHTSGVSAYYLTLALWAEHHSLLFCIVAADQCVFTLLLFVASARIGGHLSTSMCLRVSLLFMNSVFSSPYWKVCTPSRLMSDFFPSYKATL